MAKKKRKTPMPTGIAPEFYTRLDEMYGEAVRKDIEQTLHRRPTTFRVNTIKASKQEIMKTLMHDGFDIEPVSWIAGAFMLRNKTKRDLIDHELYAAGKIYVQSIASMVPPLILNPEPGEKVLDLTAAPGSKTSQMAAMMNKTGELVANDSARIRFYKLQHNMTHLGVSDEAPDWQFTLRMEHGAVLCREYPNYFDKVLLDAPCGGEARFTLDNPKSFAYWKERKIKEMAFKQRKLIFSAFTALKPGGTLVYSTCTFAPEENELQISRLIERLDGEVVVLPIELDGPERLPAVTKWRGKDLHPSVTNTLRIKPTADTEGFFVAKLTKR